MKLSQFLSLGKDLIISLWKQPIILSTACFRQPYPNELLLLYLSSYCTLSADYTVPLCLHACTCFHLVHTAPLPRPNQVYVITYQVQNPQTVRTENHPPSTLWPEVRTRKNSHRNPMIWTTMPLLSCSHYNDHVPFRCIQATNLGNINTTKGFCLCKYVTCG